MLLFSQPVINFANCWNFKAQFESRRGSATSKKMMLISSLQCGSKMYFISLITTLYFFSKLKGMNSEVSLTNVNSLSSNSMKVIESPVTDLFSWFPNDDKLMETRWVQSEYRWWYLLILIQDNIIRRSFNFNLIQYNTILLILSQYKW